MQEKIQNISPVKQRIAKYVDSKGISRRKFYELSGISRGTLENNTGISEDTMAKFFALYPDANPLWIFTGKGFPEISADNSYINIVSESKANYMPNGCEYCAQKDKTIQALENNVEILNRYVRCLEAELNINAPATEGAKKKGAA